jgi:hypothetical protein
MRPAEGPRLARSDQTPKGIVVDVRSGGRTYPSPPAKSHVHLAGSVRKRDLRLADGSTTGGWKIVNASVNAPGFFTPFAAPALGGQSVVIAHKALWARGSAAGTRRFEFPLGLASIPRGQRGRRRLAGDPANVRIRASNWGSVIGPLFSTWIRLSRPWFASSARMSSAK